MADIRINALATTATTPASDDYLALDGAAQGTRKILATNIANNVTDVILGASGPSVKSTLSARAPRQGLVFDGSAGATVSGVPAFGTSDFTVVAWVNPTLSAECNIISGNAASAVPQISISTNGTISLSNQGVGTIYSSSAGAMVANQTKLVVWRRTGGTSFLYIDGILNGSGSDTTNFTTAIGNIGSRGFYGGLIFSGRLSVLIYNRALSASEVVALYEAGAPAGADYGLIGQPASNTSIITGDSSTFTSGVGNWTGFNGGSISAVGGKGVISMASYHQGAANNTNQMVAGRRYRLTVTVSALVGGSYVLLTDFNSVEYASLTAGVNVVEFTSRTNTGIAFKQGNSGTTSASVDDISLLPIGLLLAPDAAQAGGGLTWYDTSGNAANITLPASGVSWNVPSSGYWGGNLTVSGTGTSSVAGNWLVGTTSDGGQKLQVAGTVAKTAAGPTTIAIASNEASNLRDEGRLFIVGNASAGSRYLGLEYYDVGNGAYRNVAAVPNGGNFLVGTPIDGGNGKLQLATHTTSAGGIGFGSDTSLYRGASGIGTLELSASSGTVSIFKVALAGTAKAQFGIAAGATYIDYDGSLLVRNGIGGTTALTLDSSQNATFAGQALSSVNAANATNFGNFVASNSTLNAFVSYTSGASADQKYWSWQSGSAFGDGVFRLRALNDAGTNGKNAIVVKRTGISSVIVNLPSLPTSSAGLAAGDLWNDSGTVKVV